MILGPMKGREHNYGVKNEVTPWTSWPRIKHISVFDILMYLSSSFVKPIDQYKEK